MIPYDETWTFDPDCSTCVHRVARHGSKRETSKKPRRCEYVCLVTARAIGEHGNFRHHVEHDRESGMWRRESWVQDVPCAVNLHDGRGWFALDYDTKEDFCQRNPKGAESEA